MQALLIIDMLEDFFREGPLRAVREELTSEINSLLDRARRVAIPIIWVRQAFRDDLDDAFLAMRRNEIRITIAGTHGAEILAELNKAPDDYEIVKKRYSAFHGTALDSLLAEWGISKLTLAGVNTHACIRTTAIDAYQRDFDVIIPRTCVASNDSEHHDVTLRYLAREIAQVLPLDDVLMDAAA